ncbi:MAG: hypothetical protein AAF903_07925 [Pseudomonadota bacterium]
MPNMDLTRIMILSRSGKDGALQYLEQTKPNGAFAPAPTAITKTIFPQFATNVDWLGRVCVVLGLTDGTFGFVMEASEYEHSVWTPPISLGGVFHGHPIKMKRNRDGRLAVFSIAAAIGEAGPVSHACQTKPMEDPTGQVWSDFESLGGAAQSITIGQNGDGTLIVFALQADGTVWFTQQDKPVPGTGWSDWAGLGGHVSRMEVISKPNGTVMLFTVQKDGSIATRSQQDASKRSWQAEWVTVATDNLIGEISQMGVAQNADGSIMLVVMDETYLSAQSLTEAGWSGWLHFHDAVPATHMSIMRNANGALDLFVGDDTTSTITHLATQPFPNAPLWRPVDLVLTKEATSMACVLDRTFVPGEHLGPLDADARMFRVG